MEERKDYTTLQYIIEQYMLSREESTLHQYKRYYQLGIKGFKRLNYDVLGSIKVCALDLSSANTIRFPKDYINYIRIGSLQGSDIHWLGVNDGILVDRCSNIVKDLELSVKSYIENPFTYNPDYFNILGNTYGYRGGNNVNGYYKIDFDKGLIAFDSVIDSKIVLEYLSDSLPGKGEVMVHKFCEEALTDYIHWKNLDYKDNVPAVKVEMARKAFLESQRLLIIRLQSFNKEELLQSLRHRNIASPSF